MKKIIIAFAAVILLAGCAKEDCAECSIPLTQQPGQEEAYRVEIRLGGLAEYTQISRAVNENGVGDIHLFFFGRQNGYHIVTATAGHTVATNLLSGTYQVYAVANCAVSPDMTKAQLDNLLFEWTDERTDMVFGCRETITVGPASSPAHELRLERALAKITYSITVGEGFDAGIVYVQFCNVPQKGFTLPSDTDPANNTYRNPAPVTLPKLRRYEGQPFYMPENRKGVRAEMTSEQDKGWAGSSYADMTYLRIRAAHAAGATDYMVYLGENNYNDFNVRRNTATHYNITIMGSNTSDVRVSTYIVRLNWNYAYEPPYQDARTDFRQYLSVNYTPNKKYGFDLQIKCTQGPAEYLTFQGNPMSGNIYDFGAVNKGSDYNYSTASPQIFCKAPVFTSSNSLVVLQYIVTDQFGHQTIMTEDYQCANYVRLYDVWDNNGGVQANMTSSGGLHRTWNAGSEEGWTNFHTITTPVTASITPLPGYTFSGWYSDRSFAPECLISKNSILSYIPTQAYIEIYPLIVPN